MGILDKLKRGISRGIGNAVQNAAERKATEALTPKINQAADQLARHNTQAEAPSVPTSNTAGLESALGRFSTAAASYTTSAAQNYKVCPKCDKPIDADKKFCPHCGEKLSDMTLAQGAVCTNCGKQNAVTEKYCSDCGTKLPLCLQEEQRACAKDEETLSAWEEILSAYPRWNCGGGDYNLERYDQYAMFTANFFGDANQAKQAVEEYRKQLKLNGFSTAGSYPSEEHLYKQIGETWYHVDTEHCFEGDPDCPSIGFNKNQPYVEEQKKKKRLFGLFG